MFLRKFCKEILQKFPQKFNESPLFCYPHPMNIFEEILKETKKHFTSTHGSHDFDHVERVLKMAIHIAKKEQKNNHKIDFEILKLATILHDIGRHGSDKEKGQTDHAKDGATIATEILKKYKFSKEKIAKITHCIEAHRFRTKTKPKTLEAKILFDADKLDSIGAIGIGRAFLFAGEIGAHLHNTEKSDMEILQTKEYGREDTAYREFLVKLRHIKGRMQTKEGHRLAKERHAFMVEFFKRMKREILEGI